MDRDEVSAAIAEHAAELDRLGDMLASGPLAEDLRSELTVLARFVLQMHDRQMPLMVALQRGDDSFDDLRTRARQEVVDRGHRHAATWLRERIASGGFAAGYDVDAVVTVALGSLLAYAAQQVTFRGPPLGVDVDRFVETWVDTWLRVASTAEREREGA
jgi:hypothetical protein